MVFGGDFALTDVHVDYVIPDPIMHGANGAQNLQQYTSDRPLLTLNKLDDHDSSALLSWSNSEGKSKATKQGKSSTSTKGW